MIKLQVIGNLGKDAEQRTVNGSKVINFTIAETKRWTDSKGEKKERTIWVDVAWWTDKEGMLPYLKKGQQVYVEGEPESRGFATKDGTIGSALTVRVGQVQLLGGSKREQKEEEEEKSKNQNESNGKSEPEDDLPF